MVQTGSFSKAAQQGYLTPPAILYRVNELEKSLGIKLFNRSSQGVTLTAAGAILHRHASDLIRRSEQVTKQVRQAAKQQSKTVRIGSSLLNPASQLMGLWDQVIAADPEWRLQFTPLETLAYSFPEMYQHLGERVDLLYGPYGFSDQTYNVRFYPFTKYHFSITMHQNDPLAQKQQLNLADLVGAQLMMVPQGHVAAVDHLYKLIDQQKLKIKTVATDVHYTIDTFNQFMAEGQYFLTLECWQHVLPGLVSRPLNVADAIPYGFIATDHPSKELAQFIATMLKAISHS